MSITTMDLEEELRSNLCHGNCGCQDEDWCIQVVAADELKRLETALFDRDVEIARLRALTDHIESERLMLRAAVSEIAQNTDTAGPDPTWKLSVVNGIARKALT